ncbi:MAG: hypothetical protein E7G07_06605 [Flavonifractor plautii]|nr:hypothetical protein [Flavonifractor plautii]
MARLHGVDVSPVSCGRVPGQAELREMLREALEKETLEQGPAV